MVLDIKHCRKIPKESMERKQLSAIKKALKKICSKEKQKWRAASPLHASDSPLPMQSEVFAMVRLS